SPDAPPWPLIPLHEVLMPDGRVLSYGTKPDGTQTGYFFYDIWRPELGLKEVAHSLLPNATKVDLFCSAQLVLPQSGDVLMLGGDNWTGSSTTNTGNNKSVVFSKAGGDHLSAGKKMNRKRWYATATTLPNGSTYIQGGKGGSDRPEVRDSDGNFKLLSNVDT